MTFKNENIMAKEKLIGQATAEQIQEWKAKHGDIFSVKVDGHVCYLHKPSRRTISYASVAAKTDPLKFNETLLRECWLGGSEAIRNDDDKFLAAGFADQTFFKAVDKTAVSQCCGLVLRRSAVKRLPIRSGPCA